MLSSNEIKNYPKTNQAFSENLFSQPLSSQKVFNQQFLLTESWYPLCPANKIKQNEARSFSILSQRIVVFRNDKAVLAAMDAFCPHMGADLGNGFVKNSLLHCYFHQLKFDGQGQCVGQASKLSNYPVCEKYGFIWVFAGDKETFSVPHPPGLEEFQVSALYFKRVKLFAHHHVMMAGGIDLKHFKTVHNLDIDFKFEVEERDSTFIWKLEGKIPKDKISQRFFHWLSGGIFKYQVAFAGGSIATITYGNDMKFRGKYFSLPKAHILWGGTPTKDGVSEVDIFLLVKKRPQWWGKIASCVSFFYTALLLNYLRDDDVKAFPHMRFDLGKLTGEDESVLKFARLINNLKVSPWTPTQKVHHDRS
jgi:phenylpropionate dioxygenase-like ring-hydroxylating dioxygenase large terminal subunit